MAKSSLDVENLKTFLDEKAEIYNQSSFLEDDPICIPHHFEKKEDIEIAAFLISTIAWGNRKSIIKNGWKLVEIMQHSPHDFILNYKTGKDQHFVHRTFNSVDLDFFFRSLKHIYLKYGGLEKAFDCKLDAKQSISQFRDLFLSTSHEIRSEKHLANPLKGSSAKRINMFLRWMVRNDKRGVDFGIWKNHSTAKLYVPLDIHTGISARKLGLISRNANDWKALEELMGVLQSLDPIDPCKYDFALFGLSVNKEL